jgi:hypothetical protein
LGSRQTKTEEFEKRAQKRLMAFFGRVSQKKSGRTNGVLFTVFRLA